MSAKGQSTAEESPPFLFLGLPLGSWAFALRTWAAMMVALYAAFWLQLDAAYDAGVTVAILAQPLRGQAFQKAAARFLATLVGTVASLAIVGAFTQARDLYIVACAAWIAACAYVSTCYDGNRAYGVVLSGYTVAFVAMAQIDTPQQAFSIGVNRVASISCGIVAVALLACISAPDVYPVVLHRLDQAHRDARALVRDILSGLVSDADRVRHTIGAITAIRPDIELLPSEGLFGGRRASAARSALVALIRSIAAVHGVSALSRQVSAENVEVVRRALDLDGPDRRAALDAVLTSGASAERIMLTRCAIDVVDEQRLAAEELASFEAGRRPRRRVRLPIHRDRQSALRLGTRVFLVVAASGFFFTLSGWPALSGAWRYVGLLGGLASIRPNARAFALVGLMTMPTMAVVVGVMEFFVLDGVDAFPLLALAFAPAVFAFSLLSLHHKPMLHGFGALGLVFLVLIYEPSNPPSYSPQTYLFNACYAISAAVVFPVLVFAFRPTTDKERCRWLVEAAAVDFAAAAQGRSRRTADEATYLMADRIARLSKMAPASASVQRRRIEFTLLLLTLTVFAIRAHGALDRLSRRGTAISVAERARSALRRLDPDALRRAVDDLVSTADLDSAARIDAIAALQFVAPLTSTRRSTLRRLDQLTEG